MKHYRIVFSLAMVAAMLVSPVWAQTSDDMLENGTLAVGFAGAAKDDFTLGGIAVDADYRLWGPLYLAGSVSHVTGEIDPFIPLHPDLTIDGSRTVYAVGPRVRVGARVQGFAHALIGQLRSGLTFPTYSRSESTYVERYGGGIDWHFSDHVGLRFQVDYDGWTHTAVGASFTF